MNENRNDIEETTDSQPEREALRAVMQILGRRRSKRKTEAVRRNGQKGGRPRGIPVSAETRAKISTTKRQKRLATHPATEEDTPGTQ